MTQVATTPPMSSLEYIRGQFSVDNPFAIRSRPNSFLEGLPLSRNRVADSKSKNCPSPEILTKNKLSSNHSTRSYNFKKSKSINNQID
jgi:hypothetical protein